MFKFINHIFILPLVLFFLSVAAFAENVHTEPKIGMLLPLSGSYASGGVDIKQGAEAAQQYSKLKTPINFVYADSKADAKTGINEFKKLVDVDKVITVLAMRGSVGMAVNSVSKSAKIPLLGVVGNKNFSLLNEYAFQIWSRSDEEGAFLAKSFHKRNYNRAAVITVQDDWQDAVSDEFRKVYPNASSKIIYDDQVVPEELDFRTILLHLRSSSPDVIFANLGLAQMGPFLRQAQEMQLTKNIYCNFWVAKKDAIDAAGIKTVEGIKFIEMDTDLPSLRKYISDKYSATPSAATLAGYASTLLLQQVFAQSSDIRSADQLYSKLLSQTEIITPDSIIPIKDRCVKFPLVEKIMHLGKAETLK